MNYQSTVKITSDETITITKTEGVRYNFEDFEQEFLEEFDETCEEFDSFELRWFEPEEGNFIVNARIEATVKRDTDDEDKIYRDLKHEFRGLISWNVQEVEMV